MKLLNMIQRPILDGLQSQGVFGKHRLLILQLVEPLKGPMYNQVYREITNYPRFPFIK